MKRIILAALFVMGTFPAGQRITAAAETWSGIISDSQCGADHGGEVDVRECTLKCVSQGDQYVLVVGGTKVVPIANQKFDGLAAHAGQSVKLTGELRDGAIVISRIDG